MKPTKQQANNVKNKPSQKVTTQVIQTPQEIRLNRIIYLIIIALSFAFYANTIPFGYTFDDKVVITKNHDTQLGFKGIKGILTSDAFSSYFGKQQSLVAGGRYRPLAVITFAIEWQLFSSKDAAGNTVGNPHISHVINIFLYALTGILLFLLLKRLLRNYTSEHWYLSIPFLTAILFIAHPIHTEVVANIKGRDEILTLLGALFALHFTLNYLDTKKMSNLYGSFFVFFLALMSKENAITFLAIIPLSIYFFTNHSIKKNWFMFVPLLGATFIFLYIRYKILGGMSMSPVPELMNDPFLNATTTQKYATIMLTWGHYLRLLFFPHPLTYDYYPYHIPLITWADFRAYVPLFIYVAMGIIALKGFAKKTVVSYALCFYIATFSIVSNLLFPIGAFMNERFIFISSIGFFIIVAYFISIAANYLAQKKSVALYGLPLLLLVIMGLYGFKSFTRNRVWESDYALFTTDVETSSESAYGNLTAGKQFYFKAQKLTDKEEQKKYYELAIMHLTKATTIHPYYVNGLYFLGEAHYDYNKNFTKTIECFERLVKLTPENAQLVARLGNLYAAHTKNFDKAIYYMEMSLKTNPQMPETLGTLGAVYFNQQNYPKAIECFEKQRQLTPQDVVPYQRIAAVYQQLNNQEKASEYINMAKQIKK